MKTTFRITTPVGAFNRSSASMVYTHAVVWATPRGVADAKREQDEIAAGLRPHATGVTARWIKDRGHGVTWHKSEAAARRAAAGKYNWDHSATLVGVFAVEAA